MSQITQARVINQFHRLVLSQRESVDSFARDIDNELQSLNPPCGEMITTLYLMMDTDFMVAMLRRNRGFRGWPSIAGVSHDPYHPLYAKVKRAFDWTQERRRKAGFPPDPWPIRFSLPDRSKDRRLTWEPIMGEIREAWKLYHRFVREGFRPFSVDSQGEPLIPVHSFDPHAGEIMFRVGAST
ncbi:hypothetical protein LCGC14_1885850 [marine sediment metagenome]|uniref:Uncharacterized protein n=1 Tax=marine sediment metagenome TaxID=412755 RepID=A0A0F9G0Y1_9ZZZZ